MDSRRPTQRDPSPSRESVSSGSNSEDEDLEEVTDSLLGTSLTVRHLEAFGRKVTTTANQLIAPVNDHGRPAGQHYQSAIRSIHKEMRSPALQRRVFGFAQTTPTDLVRSKLSSSEIHQRALASVPDELLLNIPEDTSTYSLFQGFQASIPDANNEAELRRARRKRLETQKLLSGPNGSAALPESLKSLKAERGALGRKLEMMGVRKNMCSAEIKEIDNKIANLNMMRKIVLDRLAGLEMDETDLENEMNQLDIKLEDLEEEVAIVDSEEISSSANAGEQSPEFMSESIYEKLPGSNNSSKDKAWKSKALRMCQSPGPPQFNLHIPKEPRTPAGITRRKDTPYNGFFEEYLDVDGHHYIQEEEEEEDYDDDDVFTPRRLSWIPANTMDDSSPIGKRSTPILHGHFEPGSQIQEIKTHNDIVTALDFDVPFGTMVTAALDDTLRVWDLNLGKCMGHLEGHTASVRCLQVEDNIVASGSMDASIRLWDLSRAKYSPGRDDKGHINGKSNINGDIDADEQQPLNPDPDNSSRPTSPPPRTPPTPEGDTTDCPIFTLEAHVDEVTALHFRNETLISGSADKTLRQWDLVKGRCVQTLDVLWAAAQASSISGAAGGASALGRNTPANADFVGAVQVFEAALAAGTADGMVRLWDLRSGQVHRSLVGHTGPVTCLQFDDVHLVTGSLDRSIRIWDLRTGSIFDAYAYDKPVTSMMFDSRRIVSAAGEDVVKVYDKTDGRHWDCGAGAAADAANTRPSVIERVRIKDGYMVEGRRDGVVGSWTC